MTILNPDNEFIKPCIFQRLPIWQRLGWMRAFSSREHCCSHANMLVQGDCARLPMPPECELKVAVETLERTGPVVPVPFLTLTNHDGSLSISCYCRRWAWGRMPEQGWDSRLGPWLHKCLTASQRPCSSPAPGQGDVYFPDTSMYVSNIPKRIRLHTRNNMPTKK